MKRILLIFGTRPEAIKMCPLIQELKNRKQMCVSVCVTGQHREMLDQVLTAFGVKPDYDLAVMRRGQTLFEITADILTGLEKVLRAASPDIVLVHGDTSTAFSAALACFYLRIPVGHVEAGLRTYMLHSPFPEEFNRQAIGLVAAFHFAPTEQARQNLLREGKPESTVFVTGNTAIDALRTTVRAGYTHPLLCWAAASRLVLLTAHRRESLGEPLLRMFRAIRRVVEETPDVKVIYPLHKNPEVRRAAARILGGHERIRLIEPLDVLDFHNFIARAFLVLTDSGGIQEEAPALGKPVLVLRSATERPEGVAAGTLRLVGTREETVYAGFRLLLNDPQVYEKMSRAANPYGDGFASVHIARILEENLLGKAPAAGGESRRGPAPP